MCPVVSGGLSQLGFGPSVKSWIIGAEGGIGESRENIAWPWCAEHSAILVRYDVSRRDAESAG
jgi:hypothetical protein